MRQAEGREVVIVEAVRTPDRARAPREGLLQGHPPERAPGHRLQRGHRPRGHRRRRGRGRHRRLRRAVRRAGPERRAQRVAAGRAADRDAGHHRRPPVRIRSAGRQLLGSADRGRRARRDDRFRGRAHGPLPVLRDDEDAGGVRPRLHAGADGQAQHRRPGPRRRDDRRPVGDLPLRARRARGALAPAGPPGHRGGPLRARDRADDASTGRSTSPTRASAPKRTSRRSLSSSPRSSRTARSRPATRRRSQTAPPPCC